MAPIKSWKDIWRLQGSDTTADRVEQLVHYAEKRYRIHQSYRHPPQPPFEECPHPPPLQKHNWEVMAQISTPVPRLKLSDGASIPMLGYGTGTAWYKTGDESKIDQACIDSVKIATNLDFTHLDGAEMYKTEPELGTAIKESGKKREDLFITTKVHQSVGDIPSAIRASLKKLKLDYVDLYLIHIPFWATSDDDLSTAWSQMEQLKEEGLAKSIGVSNFQTTHLDAILPTAKYPPVINQIEFHPYLSQPDLIAYHKEHNIATAGYAPLIPITKSPDGPLDGYLAGLAKKYAVSEAEILLRWNIEQDVVTITTSGNEQRLSDYLRCCTFKLTPKEVQDIKEKGSQRHFRGFWKAKIEGEA
ncbi:MAG: hypothetical protein Q9159_006669 [Coniocarpon cinnabarinum]